MMDTERALEMARCAEINLDNLKKMVPLIGSHPLFQIVKFQIRGCIDNLDAEIKYEKKTPKCPYCKSENIRQVMYNDYGVKYPMMECKDCGEAGEYDWFDFPKSDGPGTG